MGSCKCDIFYQLTYRGKTTGLLSEPARRSCDNCQRMSDFDSFQSNRTHTDGVKCENTDKILKIHV